MKPPQSSRQRYRAFVKDYKARRLDYQGEAVADAKGQKPKPPNQAREHMRAYLRWLWPHRYAAGAFFLLALSGAGLAMVEPLFMRYIIDRVLLNKALDGAVRMERLNLAGLLFVGLVITSNLLGGVKDYRQRLLNI